MPDEFDVHRQWDNAAEEVADEAMDKLDEAKDKRAEPRDKAGVREGGLTRLDENHYFDPENRQVLFKKEGAYSNLGHKPYNLNRAASKVEAAALGAGCKPIAGGLFWDAGLKRLYVKNGGRYVLYALDRREPDPPPAPAAERS